MVGVDILPFHNFAEAKYERLGRNYFFKGFPNIYEENIKDYLEIVAETGLWDTSVGGLIGVEKEGNGDPNLEAVSVRVA